MKGALDGSYLQSYLSICWFLFVAASAAVKRCCESRRRRYPRGEALTINSKSALALGDLYPRLPHKEVPARGLKFAAYASTPICLERVFLVLPSPVVDARLS